MMYIVTTTTITVYSYTEGSYLNKGLSEWPASRGFRPHAWNAGCMARDVTV